MPETTTPYLLPLAINDRGDVGGVLDTTGTVAAWTYTPYGEPTSVFSGARPLVPASVAARLAAQPIRYAGYLYDEFSGYYYCSQRYYDPVTCQFLTRDPAGADAQESAYQYCGGDPVGKVDPSGEKALKIKAFPYKHEAFTNVSSYFQRIFKANAAYARRKAGSFKWYQANAKLKWFKQMVGNKCAWDLKQKLDRRNVYYFAGRLMQGQDIGNMHYGFVGRAYGYSKDFLQAAAGAAQVVAGNSNATGINTWGDDPRDQGWIRRGFDAYGGWGRVPPRDYYTIR